MRKAVFAVMAMVVLAGCATVSNKPPVDQKADVMKVMEQWKHGMETKNVDEMMETLSKTSFTSADFGGDTDLLINTKNSIAEGSLDNAKVSFDQAQITIEDEKATVYPVHTEASIGEATLSFQLKREDGKWFIVNMEQD
ncbi:MAG: hypothetical protein RBU21_10765 [FCB group bacterium]|nr:hypothetical protein [FCB group bacterium]